MAPGDRGDLAETARGFQCCYSVHDRGLLVWVKEKQVRFDDEAKTLTAFWFFRSSVGVYFATSREQARFVVERHLALYDADLAATLEPVWRSWEDVQLPALAQAPPVLPLGNLN